MKCPKFHEKISNISFSNNILLFKKNWCGGNPVFFTFWISNILGIFKSKKNFLINKFAKILLAFMYLKGLVRKYKKIG